MIDRLNWNLPLVTPAMGNVYTFLFSNEEPARDRRVYKMRNAAYRMAATYHDSYFVV